ncbi:MAG: hypothetical protein WBP85_08800 [Terracidiphilus sp.]
MFRSFPVDRSEWLERQRDLLVKIHARGKRRFVSTHGTLWAGAFLVFTNLISVFIFHKVVDWEFFPISFAIALAAGYGNGFWMWNRYEKKYRELSARR